MAAANKGCLSRGRDDSFAEPGIPTGEKVDIQHVEKLDTTDPTAGVKASQVYENMAPIVELGLPDWRATEKALVRRLDMSLMPTSESTASILGMLGQCVVVTYSVQIQYGSSILTIILTARMWRRRDWLLLPLTKV